MLCDAVKRSGHVFLHHHMHTLRSSSQTAPFLPTQVNSLQLKMTFLEQTAEAPFLISVGLRLDRTDLAQHNPSDFNLKIPLIHLANLQKKVLSVVPRISLNFGIIQEATMLSDFKSPDGRRKKKRRKRL